MNSSNSPGALPRLVLASASPRRRTLLAGLSVRPEVRPVDISEEAADGERPEQLVARLAREKAGADTGPGELVLAADTLVVLDGEILGKPIDERQAIEMLGRLAGREHTVLTGVALLQVESGHLVESVERSRVRIVPLTPEEIRWYVQTGEPMDKAGAYAIQGIGALFVESVSGSYTNVVGLPLTTVSRLFRRLDLELLAFRDPV